MQTLWIPMRMPGLNEIIDANRDSPFIGAKQKKKWGETVTLFARAQGFRPIERPAHFSIECVEPNKRRDPDNFVSGALKLTMDGLQAAGLLKNDGWEDVLSISATWRLDKQNPGVRVTVREA